MGHYLPYLMESLWKIQRITHVNVSDTVLCLVTQLCSILCDPMDVPCQVPLSLEFSRQEYWSGLPFPSPGDLLNPRVKPGSLTLQADSLPSEPPGRATEGRAIYKREHLKSLPLWVYIQVTVEKYTINKIKM